MAAKFTAADMTGTNEGGSAALSSIKKIVSDMSGNSELPISEGAELPQIQRHAVDTEQFFGLSRTFVQFVLYVLLYLATGHLMIDGVCLMYGAPKEADILGFAVPIGKKLLGSSTPFLGVVMVLFMLHKVTQTSKVTKAKVVIISWLIVCLILGVSLPFTEAKEAVIKDKATAMYFNLVTVLALAVLTNLHDL